MANIFVKSGSGTAGAATYRGVWVASTTWSVGARVVATNATRYFVYECTTGGAGTDTEPTWGTTVGGTTADGGAVFTCRAPSTWANATMNLERALADDAAGDTIYVSQAHAESTAANVTLSIAGTNASPTRIICADDAADPPTTAATTGVMETGNGAYTITFSGVSYCYGMSFRCGVGNTANSSRIDLGPTAGVVNTFEKCNFSVATTVNSVNAHMKVGFNGAANGTPYVRFRDCNVKFGHAAQTISVECADFRWHGGAIESGSAAITTLFHSQAGFPRVGDVFVEGVDLSAGAAAMNLVNATNMATTRYTIRNCKLPASWTGAPTTGSFVVPGQRVSMYNCDNADTNYKLWIVDYAGSIRDETTLIRTGGASDGTTGLSWKVVSGSLANETTAPLQTDDIVIWNETTGASKTVSVELLHDSQGSGSSSNLTNADIWLSVRYYGTAGVPLGSIVTARRASVLATAANHAASTETWTTTGLTTPLKQKLSVSFTPQEKGFFIARVHLAKPSATVYVDPKLTVA